MAWVTDVDAIAVIAPNFKRRLSGVTSTIVALVPAQAAAGLVIATFGPGLPDHLPKLRSRDVWKLWRRPRGQRHRIWHARRNSEMAAGIIMRDLLRMPLRLVFTSAAQRRHQPFTRWMIGRMNHVIATSAKSAAFLDVPATVIMHGVDTQRFRPPDSKASAKSRLRLDPDRKLVGCTGRVRPSKGTDLFVDAMIAILPQQPDWDAVITGRTTAEHTAFKRGLEQRIADAGLGDRIRFVGEVADIVSWYQAFDLFVAPSRVEGFGLTPLEAMACGVPVVVSDAGAYADCVPRGNVETIVRGNDHRAFANTTVRIMDDLGSWPESTMVSHARSNLSIDREVGEINGIYAELQKTDHQ